MESKKSKLPAGAIELYNVYIHGGMSRRDFLDGAQKLAVGGLPVAAMVEGLLPNYAAAQQVPKDDKRLKTGYATVPSPQGNGSIKGYLARPASASGKLPGILVIHENRGLNPHIEDVARRFALENFMAFAPDGLTSVGGYPNDDYRGGQLFGKIDPGKRIQDFLASAQWLRTHPLSSGKVCATGFCFGGGVCNTLAT